MNRVYSVGQVNTYIKNMFVQDYLLRNLAVRGEVSNCKYHPSGHIYFSLKDETGCDRLCDVCRTEKRTGFFHERWR